METLKMDKAAVQNHWHARGFTCGLWIDHAGRVWSNDAQETGELFMALAGELELEMEGRKFLAPIGEEIFIPAHVPHIVRNVGGKTARWLYGLKALRDK